MRRYVAGVILGCGIATVALAATPQEVIQARQANFKAIGKANKAVQDELRKPAPDVAVIRINARQLVTLSAQLPRWFPQGTGPETGVKTGALPAVWAKKAEFRRAAVNFNKAARTLEAAAARADVAAVTASGRALGPTCKGCHESFRAKDD
jgi:cytochrome c556